MATDVWTSDSHRLDKMSMGDLVRAYVRHPSVIVYAALAVPAWALAVMLTERPWGVVAAALAGVILYPLAWYVLHRFVLHSRLLYKSPLTASLWKRIHYDHHQDPRDMRVLFGALYTTLPTIGAILIPIGWILGGVAGAAAGFASGVTMTIVYEFFHCVQHLNVTPKNPFLKRIKRLHLAHHYHDETSNFGIIDFAWDRILGTYQESMKGRQRSATVFNLGYDEAVAERYPWVAQLSPARPQPADAGGDGPAGSR